MQECAAKIYCRIAVTLQFSVSMIGNIVYIPHSNQTFEKVILRQYMDPYEPTCLSRNHSLFPCINTGYPKAPI